jgi:hypothetical protein
LNSASRRTMSGARSPSRIRTGTAAAVMNDVSALRFSTRACCLCLNAPDTGLDAEFVDEHPPGGFACLFRPQLFATGDRAANSAGLMFASPDRTQPPRERMPLTLANACALSLPMALSLRLRSLYANTDVPPAAIGAVGEGEHSRSLLTNETSRACW